MLPFSLFELFSIIAGGSSLVGAVTALYSILKSSRDLKEQATDLSHRRTQLEAAITQQPENQTGSPKLAWDLARITLEQYFTRNLGQTRLLFGVSLVVMMSGFTLVVWSTIYAALHDPAKAVSWVGAASGVITQFIGATFMVMYKSTTKQSADYVRILERINAVGMSVQLLEDIPKDDPLLTTTKAEMARLLLEGSIYRRTPGGAPKRSESSKAKRPAARRRSGGESHS